MRLKKKPRIYVNNLTKCYGLTFVFYIHECIVQFYFNTREWEESRKKYISDEIIYEMTNKQPSNCIDYRLWRELSPTIFVDYGSILWYGSRILFKLHRFSFIKITSKK